jgi:hypothetical protein
VVFSFIDITFVLFDKVAEEIVLFEQLCVLFERYLSITECNTIQQYHYTCLYLYDVPT